MLFSTRFPLLTLLLIVYNVMLAMFGSDLDLYLNQELIGALLFSGAYFSLIAEDLLVMVGILLLFFEVIKSTRSGKEPAVEHIFSMFVFLVFLLEFITVPSLGTPTFLIITLFSLFDVMAGFTISIVTARRDISVN